MRGIWRMTSSHIALVSLVSMMPNVATSWLPAPRPGTELVALIGEVVEHGGALGDADGVVLHRRQADDGRPEVDALGRVRAVADQHLAGGEVAVLGEGVVLAEPRVLPVVLVGEDRVLGLAHQRGVLRPGVVRSGAGDVAVEEDAELHEVSLRGT